MSLIIPEKNDLVIDPVELVQLGATDSIFFSRTVFPNTARVQTPDMHRDVWRLLDSNERYINIIMSRGWAKTSLLRMYCGKRVAYGISHTILFVGATQAHSRRSLRWLRKQVESNKRFRDTFRLRPGTPWTDEEAKIIHEVDEKEIWLIALGITASGGRGINFDDHRPDLILLDDVMNDENSVTKEGRQKIQNLVFGAFKESLAPRSEAPLAKLVMLNTPQDYDDISQQALKDQQFKSAVYGCWTKETENLPLQYRESAWPELVPTPELQEEYRAAAARNTLSIFIREKECKLVTPETSAFREEWLQYYEEDEVQDDDLWNIMIIDPVPPPTDIQLAKGITEGDYEAISVLGRAKGKIYLRESVCYRGHTPNRTIEEFFRLAQKFNVRKCLVEAVAYQKTLLWLLQEAMRVRGIYYLVEPFGAGDKRSKEQKILDGLLGITANRKLYVKRDQVDFLEQYRKFSLIKKIGHDDVIETVAIGCLDLQNKGFNLPGGGMSLMSPEYEDNIPDLDDFRGAP